MGLLNANTRTTTLRGSITIHKSYYSYFLFLVTGLVLEIHLINIQLFFAELINIQLNRYPADLTNLY